MALKDKWTDKVNGRDINNADDINMVAQAVIDLEEKGVGGSVEILPTTGDREDAVMSQKAATDAFVPKIINTSGLYQAYCNKNVKGKAEIEVMSVNHALSDWSIARRYGNGRLRVGEAVENDDATNLKYFNDHTPRFRHTIHSDTEMGDQSYVAFTLNIYSTSSIAFTNETFISALGEKVNGKTPRISVSGCIVENGIKTQIIGLFFDNDSGFVVVDDTSLQIRTGLSTLSLFDDVVQV